MKIEISPYWSMFLGDHLSVYYLCVMSVSMSLTQVSIRLRLKKKVSIRLAMLMQLAIVFQCFFSVLMGNKHETDLCIFELLGKCPCVAMKKHNTTINICMSLCYIGT